MKSIRIVAVDGAWTLELDGSWSGHFESVDQAIETALRWADVASSQGAGVRVLIPTEDDLYQVKVFSHKDAA